MCRLTHALPVTIVSLALAGVVGGLVLVSCGGGMMGLKGADAAFVEPDFWARAEAMFGDDGGGYWLRQKETQLRYEGGNWYVKETYHTQIVVLDADRLEEYADFSIPFGPSSRLVSVKARTITSTGEVIPVSSENMHDKSTMPEFMLYSDRKARVFPMPGFGDRCVLDVSFEREDQDLYFMDEFVFGSRLPVRTAKYAYTVDSRIYEAGLRVYYKPYNLDVKPTETAYAAHFGQLVQIGWELDNIEAYPDERWMPPREVYLPRVTLSGFRPGRQPDDWSEFTSWYAKVLPKFDEVAKELGADIALITGDRHDEREIMQAMLDYFGENIRYVSVDINESGWTPHSPVDVMKTKYGDCKDMACLAVSMLRRRGIEAYPALVRTRDYAPIDPQLVVPLFNHMIVYVESDEGELWLDPTAAPYPLGYVPSVERDVDALVIHGKDPLWKRIPATTPFGSARATATTIAVAPTGLLTAEFRTAYSGDMGVERKWSYAKLGSKDLKEVLQDDALTCFHDVSLDTCVLASIDDREPLVRIAGRFNKRSAAIRLEDRMALRLDFLRPMVVAMADLPKGAERKFPLWVPFSFEEIDTLRVTIPAGWEVATLPMDLSSADKYGSYSIACSQEGGEVVIVVFNQLAAGEYQGNRYADFIDFWSRARERLNQDIIFRKI
jgi:transglutaminase-like putative cysteine protease